MTTLVHFMHYHEGFQHCTAKKHMAARIAVYQMTCNLNQTGHKLMTTPGWATQSEQ